jgi:hypothetical protein
LIKNRENQIKINQHYARNIDNIIQKSKYKRNDEDEYYYCRKINVINEERIVYENELDFYGISNNIKISPKNHKKSLNSQSKIN